MDWKKGDKCWVYSPDANTAGGSIDEGEFIDSDGTFASIQLPFRDRPYDGYLLCLVFRTREELCAFYRKIFE